MLMSQLIEDLIGTLKICQHHEHFNLPLTHSRDISSRIILDISGHYMYIYHVYMYNYIEALNKDNPDLRICGLQM